MALRHYKDAILRAMNPFEGEDGGPIHVHGIVAILIVSTYLLLVLLQIEVPEHLLSALTLVLGFLFGKHYREED